jgi:phosphoglycolate phosphatase
MDLSLKQCRLAMFDLDGTLVDSVFDIHAALNKALVACGYPVVGESQAREWVGNGAQALVNRALNDCLHPEQEHADLEHVLDVFYQQYRVENGRNSVCYEGAKELLMKLRTVGCKVAIVTNKPLEHAQELVAQLALEHDLLLGGDSLEYRKPHPLPLLHCLAHFSVQPDAAVMVGDSVNDFEAAHAAKVPVIGVSYGYNHGLPIDARNIDGLVDSLNELG